MITPSSSKHLSFSVKRISYPLLLQKAPNQQTLTSNDGDDISFEHQHEGSGSMLRWFIQFIWFSNHFYRVGINTTLSLTGGENEAKLSDFPRLHGSKFPFPTFKSLLLQVWPSSVPTQGKEVRLHGELGSNRPDSKVSTPRRGRNPYI